MPPKGTTLVRVRRSGLDLWPRHRQLSRCRIGSGGDRDRRRNGVARLSHPALI